ncbi:hypothetical protein KGQ20_12805 [Catenulispora sp. NF23]|uniref:hypothetical protein n=1 Tax=Catenulispora pinistramenti TaxID=2705254 RepID=UPI001BAC7218|nr:hypothetical protein [Catenulispora pinistramenti]MBS2533651.1 hypothetical protein [Catenulispora pinistramenti]
MADELSVDTDMINQAMPPIQYVMDQMQSLASGLVDQLKEYNGCWGDDKTGNTFATKYLPLTQQMEDGITSTGDAIKSMHDGVRTTVLGFTQTEDATGDIARNLRQPQDPATPAK